MYPKEILKDQRLKDFDVRLLFYFHFDDMNMNGYTTSTNRELAHKLNRAEPTIKKAIDRLIELEYLHIEYDIKANEIYPEDYKRVVWAYMDFFYGRNRENQN